MKKKLTSIILSAILISQVGIIPQISAGSINNNQSIIINDKNSKKSNSKFINILKYVGGTAIATAGSYLSYNYLKQKYHIPLAHTVHPVPATPINERINNFREILDRYLNNTDLLTEEEINQICDEAIPVLKRESSMLRIAGPTTIVGDIHGDIKALEFCIEKFLEEVENGKSILFLGDYVDRGSNSIKNIALLLKLKTMFPDKVFLLRGNHEDTNVNSIYGLFEECRKDYDNINYEKVAKFLDYSNHIDDDVPGVRIYKKINSTFDYLSLAATINDHTFCVHGGISPKLNNLYQIHNIKKPLSFEELNENGLAMDLLWSDPDSVINGFFSNRRGAGQIYGKDVVDKFLAKNNLNRIIRAHEEVNKGYEDKFGDGSVITLFSAPNYCKKGNKGCIINYSGDNSIRYNIVKIRK